MSKYAQSNNLVELNRVFKNLYSKVCCMANGDFEFLFNSGDPVDAPTKNNAVYINTDNGEVWNWESGSWTLQYSPGAVSTANLQQVLGQGYTADLPIELTEDAARYFVSDTLGENTAALEPDNLNFQNPNGGTIEIVPEGTDVGNYTAQLQAKSGVLAYISDISAGGPMTINTQVADYTLQLADGDNNTLVNMDVAIANTITVDSAIAFPIGTNIMVSSHGAGQTTLVPAGTTVILTPNSVSSVLTFQNSGGVLVKLNATEWYFWGDVGPTSAGTQGLEDVIVFDGTLTANQTIDLDGNILNIDNGITSFQGDGLSGTIVNITQTGSNDTIQFQSFIPITDNGPGFYNGVARYQGVNPSPSNGDPDNYVWNIGTNINVLGTPLDTNFAAWAWSYEHNFQNGGVMQSEAHLVHSAPLGAGQDRVWSINMAHDRSSSYQYFTTDYTWWQNNVAEQYAHLNSSGSLHLFGDTPTLEFSGANQGTVPMPNSAATTFIRYNNLDVLSSKVGAGTRLLWIGGNYNQILCPPTVLDLGTGQGVVDVSISANFGAANLSIQHFKTTNVEFTSGGNAAKIQASAGTANYNFNLPVNAGTSGYILSSAGGGSNAMTWVNPATIVPNSAPFIDGGATLSAVNREPTNTISVTGFNSTIVCASGSTMHGNNSLIAAEQTTIESDCEAVAVIGGSTHYAQDVTDTLIGGTSVSVFSGRTCIAFGLGCEISNATSGAIIGSDGSYLNASYSGIYSGQTHTLNPGAEYSVILGGYDHLIDDNSTHCAIIGGSGCFISTGVDNAVVIGMVGKNATVADTVYVQNLTADDVITQAGYPVKPYTTIVGILTQSGTSDPVFTELENTTGSSIICTRSGSGDYDFTSGSAIFTANKTVVHVGQSGAGGDIITTNYTIDTDSNISIFTWNGTSFALTDDLLQTTSIEIKIYP